MIVSPSGPQLAGQDGFGLISNGGFSCFLLFDHNSANWAPKRHHYDVFGDYVIPHIKQTNRRLRQSELAKRAVRDGFAAAQKDAIGAFAAKHAKS